jgi:hypothetical protein
LVVDELAVAVITTELPTMVPVESYIAPTIVVVLVKYMYTELPLVNAATLFLLYEFMAFTAVAELTIPPVVMLVPEYNTESSSGPCNVFDAVGDELTI